MSSWCPRPPATSRSPRPATCPWLARSSPGRSRPTSEPAHARVGVGFDAHRFAAGRRLVLGGIDIPHPLGLVGHSDADVVTHAVIDAVLGAAGLADIGVLFPDSDPAFSDAASVRLLEDVMARVREWGWRVGNVDVVVVLEEPRLADHRQRMRERLAEALGTGVENVWVKAKTTEGMGFEGRREGVSATAVCLLRPA